MIDVNVYQENIFPHQDDAQMSSISTATCSESTSTTWRLGEQRDDPEKIRREMLEIFYGRNISRSDEAVLSGTPVASPRGEARRVLPAWAGQRMTLRGAGIQAQQGQCAPHRQPVSSAQTFVGRDVA